MVEVPDTSDVTDMAFDSAKAAGGAIVGANLGQNLLGGNPTLGAAAGGIAGSMLTGKGAENKAAATFVMATMLPKVLNSGGLSLNVGGGQTQQASGGAPGAI